MVPAASAPTAVKVTGAPGAPRLVGEPSPCAVIGPVPSDAPRAHGDGAGSAGRRVDGGPAVAVDAARDADVAADRT